MLDFLKRRKSIAAVEFASGLFLYALSITQNPKIEDDVDELLYLRIFSVDWALVAFAPPDVAVRIREAYGAELKQFASLSRNPAIYSKNLLFRFDLYGRAADVDHHQGVGFTIGTAFAALCEVPGPWMKDIGAVFSRNYSVMTVLRGTTEFASVVDAVRESLQAATII